MIATRYTVASFGDSGSFSNTDLIILTNSTSVIYVWIKQTYTKDGFPSEVVLPGRKRAQKMIANGVFFRLSPLDNTGGNYRAIKMST